MARLADSSKRTVIIVGALVVVAALAGTYVAVTRSKQPVDAAQAPSGSSAASAADEAARKRMLREIEKAAEATPAPEEPDPSDLPSIDEVLAEDDAGAGEPDAE